MSFAEKWAAIDAALFGASEPMDTMDRMDTIQPGGNSVHCVHIVHSISTLKKGGASPRTALDALNGLNTKNARPSREACQEQGCAAWLSGGKDDPACAWRCIGSIVHGGMDPEAAHKPRLADLDTCPHGKLNTGTGLDDWPEHPPDGVEFGAYESAGSLLDLCRRHDLHVVITDGKARIIYPVGASEALREYAATLLAEAREFIERMQNVVGDAPTEVHQ